MKSGVSYHQVNKNDDNSIEIDHQNRINSRSPPQLREGGEPTTSIKVVEKEDEGEGEAVSNCDKENNLNLP